jgi:hypothetical protein
MGSLVSEHLPRARTRAFLCLWALFVRIIFSSATNATISQRSISSGSSVAFESCQLIALPSVYILARPRPVLRCPRTLGKLSHWALCECHRGPPRIWSGGRPPPLLRVVPRHCGTSASGKKNSASLVEHFRGRGRAWCRARDRNLSPKFGALSRAATPLEAGFCVV